MIYLIDWLIVVTNVFSLINKFIYLVFQSILTLPMSITRKKSSVSVLKINP